MAPHSSTLAWKIPWMEEPSRLQFMESLRVGHDWVTSLSRIGEGNGNPLHCSCLENLRDEGACWVSVYGVAQSHIQLKRLSSNSSSSIRCFNLNIINDTDIGLIRKWGHMGQSMGKLITRLINKEVVLEKLNKKWEFKNMVGTQEILSMLCRNLIGKEI